MICRHGVLVRYYGTDYETLMLFLFNDVSDAVRMDSDPESFRNSHCIDSKLSLFSISTKRSLQGAIFSWALRIFPL